VTRYIALLPAVIMLCWSVISPTPALAHAGTGPHGGPVTDAGPYYVELLVKDGQMRLFAFDDKTDAPISAKNAHGTATVLIGDKKDTVELAPAGGADDNLFSGPLAAAGPGTRIVIILHYPGQPSIIARFAI
jgi:hypothetical protein